MIAIPKKDTVFRFEIPLVEKEEEEEGEGAQVEGDAVQRDKMEVDATGMETGVRITKSKNLVFELHGSQFEHRPVDRATRKFKQHRMDYL